MKKLKSISSGNYLNKLKKRRSFICGIKGKFLTNKEIVFLRKYKPWGIILFSRNIDNIYQLRLLTNMIKKLFNDKNFPILIDEEGGRVSRFSKIIDTKIFTAEYFGNLYKKNKKKFNLYLDVYLKQISYLLKSSGINFNTSPVLDIRYKNKHKIIGDRSYSSNPKIVSYIGKKVIFKFHQQKICSIIKHIPGHGLANVDSHKKLPIINKSINYLLKNDFYPFVNNKAFIAMTAHILINNYDKINCVTHSKKIIKLIREKIGFKNIIITDDISMKALKHPIQISTIKAFDAGCDIVLHCNGNINEMTKVAKNSPKLSSFLIKKTSQLNKFLS